ncbi:MAG: hypothetical protein KIC77_05650 [Clostridiales bacterium]|nr:hypothetical protein [Clostridiales bacterium]
MKTEFRYTWIDQISNEFLKADILSFGSESCIIPVLHIARYWSLFLSLLGKYERLKIVTPRIAQNELRETMDLLKRIFDLNIPIDIVVNDWGLLKYCSVKKNVFNIHIGRQLSRSLVDCPWHEEILKNEKINVQEIMREHPFNSTKMIKTLKEMGVVGIELNSLERGMNLQFLLKSNLEVSIHEKNYLITCGRTCLAQKILQGIPCYELCDKQYELELAGKWFNVFQNQNEVNDYERAMLNGLSVSGKKVTLPQKLSLEEMCVCGVNVIIASKVK